MLSFSFHSVKASDLLVWKERNIRDKLKNEFLMPHTSLELHYSIKQQNNSKQQKRLILFQHKRLYCYCINLHPCMIFASYSYNHWELRLCWHRLSYSHLGRKQIHVFKIRTKATSHAHGRCMSPCHPELLFVGLTFSFTIYYFVQYDINFHLHHHVDPALHHTHQTN